MKFISLLPFLAAFIAYFNAPVTGQVCVINLNRNCSSTRRACGRLGSSSLCVRFRNVCALQLTNCASSVSYRRVRNRLCRGIGLNRRGFCGGSSGLSSSNGAIVINLG